MNHLAGTTSPYLLQHADNPVDWYPWGEAALTRAKSEDKPIFLSIGYAACHWCHVMAHETFEDPQTAALMNRDFVNIKVDREERPDLDSIYMSATVALTGSGGWPMSVFLTPDLEPFYAGTYFPPVPRYNLPSFRELLTAVAQAWANERSDVVRIGGQVAERMRSAAVSLTGTGMKLDQAWLDGAAANLAKSYDWGFGGWGGAPKFPQPMTIEFMLRRSVQPDQKAKAEAEPLKLARHVLQAMARGGMYDVVGGGFHRYSVDNLWRVPHFEKMLYDNAQLALVYLHGWQLTGEAFFRDVATGTLDFVERELTSPEGGFYSSLDADSEGEEGKYYAWRPDEINATLGADAEFFSAAYGVTAQGNWEGRTVLQRALDDGTLASRFKLERPAVTERLAGCYSRLLAARAARTPPATDDKVLTAWNGLMLQAFAEAGRVLAGSAPGSRYRTIAARNAEFLLTALRPDGNLRRAWRAGSASSEVFLEDYAALIVGLLELYQTDFDVRWFAAARDLAGEMIRDFADPEGGFFDTGAPVGLEPAASLRERLPYRPKDIQDSATPSGNALACDALLRLAAFTDHADYRARAGQMLGGIAEPALRYPTAFGRWLQAADFAIGNVKQIAVVGDLDSPETRALLDEIRSNYRPRAIVAASGQGSNAGAPELLNERPMRDGRPTAYVCEGFVCRQPVTSPEALRGQL